MFLAASYLAVLELVFGGALRCRVVSYVCWAIAFRVQLVRIVLHCMGWELYTPRSFKIYIYLYCLQDLSYGSSSHLLFDKRLLQIPRGFVQGLARLNSLQRGIY